MPSQDNKIQYHYILIFILSVFLFVCLSRNLLNPSPFFDIWLHLASLRELIHHPADTFHPLFLTKAPHRDYAPFYLILSKLAVIWGKDVFLTYKIGGILSFIFYSLFFTGLLGRAFAFDSKLKALTLLGTLFLWGGRWMWSGVYSFDTLAVTAGYPSFFGFSMAIGSLYYLYGYLYEDSWRELLLSVVLFYMFFVTYPAVFPFYLINVILLIPQNKKKLFLLVPIGLIVILLSFQWPFFPFKSIFIDVRYFKKPLFEPMVMFKRTWPVIIAGYATFSLPRNDKLSKFCRKGFIISILLCVMIMMLNMSIDLWGRFLLTSFFYLQIGFSVYIAQAMIRFAGFFKRSTYSGQIQQKVFAVFLLLICCNHAINTYRGNNLRRNIPLESYKKVGAILGDRIVVLSDAVTGWPLPAFGPKIISPIYRMVGISDEFKRRKDVSSFMFYPEKQAEGNKILSKYHAQYILINKRLIHDYARFKRFGEVIYSDDSLLLIDAK